MSNQISIPALFLNPQALASLFFRPGMSQPPQPPPGVPASSIPNPYLQVVAEVYKDELDRWPTEQELKEWESVALNPGAHASIARLMGMRLGKGKLLPLTEWEKYVREKVAQGAPAEIAQRQAELARWEEEQQKVRGLGDAIFGLIFETFGPKQQKPIETLAMKEFKLRKERDDLEKMLLLSQLFGMGSPYGMPLQYWLGQSQQLNVPGAVETLARLRTYYKTS